MSTKPALSQNCNTHACNVPCSSGGTEKACPSAQCVCDATGFSFSTGVYSSCVLKDSNTSIGSKMCEKLDEYDTSDTTYDFLSVYSKYEFPSDFDLSYFNVPDVNGGSYSKVNGWSEFHDWGNPIANGYDGSDVKGKTFYCGDILGDNDFPKVPYGDSKYTNISQAVAIIRAHFKSRYSNRNKCQFWITYYLFAYKTLHKEKFKRIAPYCINTLDIPIEVDGVTITEGKCFSAEYENSYAYSLVTDNSAAAKKAVAESFVDAFYKCYVSGVDSFIGSYNTVQGLNPLHRRRFQVPYYLFHKDFSNVITNTVLSTKDKGLYDQVIISGTGTSLDGTYSNLRASNYEVERKWNKNRELYSASGASEPVFVGRGTWDDNDGYYHYGHENMTNNDITNMRPLINGWDLEYVKS